MDSGRQSPRGRHCFKLLIESDDFSRQSAILIVIVPFLPLKVATLAQSTLYRLSLLHLHSPMKQKSGA